MVAAVKYESVWPNRILSRFLLEAQSTKQFLLYNFLSASTSQ